ncbi:MAG: branched-chain amino acid transport system substrate-binding protein, partial [Hyphomicrobiales bacterium]|nr:branched-chain amino acid transport system substrate-binding protein [Hyphomicrobiales bacterium]
HVRRHGADHGVAHIRQQVVIGDVAGADQLDAGLVEPALDELLDEGDALSGGHEDELRIGLRIGGALQERRDVRVRERHADRGGDLPAAGREGIDERGLDKAGIKLIGPGDVTDDDLLTNMGDAVLGAVTAHNYSAAHPSKMNKDYVAAFEKANGFRPNFISVGGYDGMHLIYEALKKTNGDTDGDKLIAAMKGMKWESPRGPISIDADTRDIIQNIYIRKVEKVNGALYNVEFATFENVKDPGKAAK